MHMVEHIFLHRFIRNAIFINTNECLHTYKQLLRKNDKNVTAVLNSADTEH